LLEWSEIVFFAEVSGWIIDLITETVSQRVPDGKWMKVLLDRWNNKLEKPS